MDAEHMDLDDDSVDGVICRFGYMLMADPAAALAETRRVLRPGGRLVFSVWGPPDRNPWVSQLGHAGWSSAGSCIRRSRGCPGSSRWPTRTGSARW